MNKQAVHSGKYTIKILAEVCMDYESDATLHLTDLQAAETKEAFSNETKLNVGTYGPRGEDEGPQTLEFVKYTDHLEKTQARTSHPSPPWTEIFDRTLHVGGNAIKALGFAKMED